MALPATVSIAQQPIGSVSVNDASISGTLEVTNGRALLTGGSMIKANDHTAVVSLQRGGEIHVCSTSGLHLTGGNVADGVQPLMLALDRGAIEIHATATTKDVVMTPDLRFTVHSAGPTAPASPLDLRIRVASNGDTCVENRGPGAPVLGVADQFGLSSYEVQAGQHVLFEHGSLREVVDHESSPCGCPSAPPVSVADAGVTSDNPAAPGKAVAPKSAAEQHPFPAAVSVGLAPAPEVPQAQPGVVHAQVATTMTFDGTTGQGSTGAPPPQPESSASSTNPASPASPAVAAKSAAPVATSEPETSSTVTKAQAPPPPPTSGGHVFRAIGRFLKHFFGA